MEFTAAFAKPRITVSSAFLCGRGMISRAIAALLVSACAAHASDWTGVYAYADWASDYRFFGVSSSNRQPALQGGLHAILPDDFYLGVFTSQVRFKDFRNTSYEADFYGGRHFIFDANDLNLELLYSTFPNQAGHAFYKPSGYIFPTYNFVELSAELSRKFDALTLSGKVLFSPAYGSGTGILWSAHGAASYAIRDWLAMDFGVGRQWIERGIDRTHWEAGTTATWRWRTQSVALDLRYYGTDLGRAQCFGMNWCGPAAVAKVTYGVAL
jgi:uncharacterized protein (TIGR02001 family)